MKTCPHCGRQNIKYIQDCDIKINPDTAEVEVDGKQISLTAFQYLLLIFLISHPNHIFSRYRLIDAIGKNHKSKVGDRSIDYHITQLRKKLGKSKKYIQTVRGMGFRFAEKVQC